MHHASSADTAYAFHNDKLRDSKPLGCDMMDFEFSTGGRVWSIFISTAITSSSGRVWPLRVPLLSPYVDLEAYCLTKVTVLRLSIEGMLSPQHSHPL